MADNVRIKIKKVDGGIDGAPPWITTFVDMISLLVTFFILLFTFSSVRNYDAFTFTQNLVGTAGIWEETPKSDMMAPQEDMMQGYDLLRGARIPHSRPTEFLLDNLDEMGQTLTDEHIEFDARAGRDGLLIRFAERAGFAPGSAQVNPVLKKALAELGETMKFYRHALVFEGFTDDAFRPSPTYPSAEALSLMRAQQAARAMLDSSGFSPELVQIAGLGATRRRSDPGASDPAIARRADRRVEVRILAMDESRARAIQEEQ